MYVWQCWVCFIVGTNKGTADAEYNHLLGIIYGLGAAVFYASVILMNKFIKGLKGVETTVAQLILASLLLLPYVVATSGFDFSNMTGKSWMYMIFLGVFNTGFAYALYFTAIKNLNSKENNCCFKLYRSDYCSYYIRCFKKKMTIFQIIGGV